MSRPNLMHLVREDNRHGGGKMLPSLDELPRVEKIVRQQDFGLQDVNKVDGTRFIGLRQAL